ARAPVPGVRVRRRTSQLGVQDLDGIDRVDPPVLAHERSVYARFVDEIGEVVEAFSTDELGQAGDAAIDRGILHYAPSLGREPIGDYASLGGFEGEEQVIAPTALLQLFAEGVEEIPVSPEDPAALQGIHDASPQRLEASAELDECIGGPRGLPKPIVAEVNSPERIVLEVRDPVTSRPVDAPLKISEGTLDRIR